MSKRSRKIWSIPTFALIALLAPAATAQEEESDQPEVTFSKDIAPIIFRSCTPCHRPGDPLAPFPLTDYRETRRRARVIGRMVDEGMMPPWLPDEEHVRFVNSQALSEEEKDLLREWIRAGAPEGDPADLPPPPDLETEWPGGEPDMVVTAEEPLTVPADAFGIVRNLVFPLELSEDRWLRGVAFRPSTNTVLRALLFVDPTGEMGDIPPDDPSALLGMTGKEPSLHFGPLPGYGGEILGDTPQPLPEGVAQKLPVGSTLVVQVYLQAMGEEVSEEPKLGLYFADEPPSERLVTVSLGTTDLSLPAGETFVYRSSFELPVPVEVVGLIPHAHKVATELAARAQLPDGAERWLLSIPEWDFTWQDQYWYEEPIPLPAGSVIEMEYTYENTEENINNPNYPPVEMGWGQDFRGEMAGLNVRLLVEGDQDLETLRKAYAEYRK